MCIKYNAKNKDLSYEDLPWTILEKLVMMEYRARDTSVGTWTENDTFDPNNLKCELNDSFDEDYSNDGNCDWNELHPLDIQLVLLQCCDPILRQLLVKKLHQCRLALPFLIPSKNNNLECCLWTMKTVVAEWKNKKMESCEESITQHPMHIVSFIRVGRPSLSKSKLLNKVLSSKGHDTFCNEESPNG